MNSAAKITLGNTASHDSHADQFQQHCSKNQNMSFVCQRPLLHILPTICVFSFSRSLRINLKRPNTWSTLMTRSLSNKKAIKKPIIFSSLAISHSQVFSNSPLSHRYLHIFFFIFKFTTSFSNILICLSEAATLINGMTIGATNSCCWMGLALCLLLMNSRPNNNRLPLLGRWNVGLAWLVERKTGGRLLRWFQMRNWTVVVIRVNFIGFEIFVDEHFDQLLGIVRTSCVKTSANLIVGSGLVRDTKLSSSVIQFLRGTLILFPQWRQWITKNQN